MKYFIKDTTANKLVIFENLPQTVNYLEDLCRKTLRKTRKQFMDEMVSLGHGYDDDQGAYFTQLMSEKFQIGVQKDNGKLVKTNIHEATRNYKFRNELGD